MRNLILLSALLFLSATVKSQNIYITFSGTGESTVVDSVTAINQTSQERITLPGNETLVLEMSSGTSQVPSQESGMTIFPNPFNGPATLLFSNPTSGNVRISANNLMGQNICFSDQFLDQGDYSFQVNIGKPGIWFINITGESLSLTGKAICTHSSMAVPSIKSINSEPITGIITDFPGQKSMASNHVLGYAEGDMIGIKGFSGVYATTITVSPISSTDYEMPFFACADSDGKNYSVVTIGSQTWMDENLAYLPTVKPSDRGSDYEPYYYVYGYEGSSISSAKATYNYKNYGVLYNWEAAKTACPSKWHLPSDDEWLTLYYYLINNGYAYGGSGNEIAKSMASQYGWINSLTLGEVGNDQTSNNSSGLSLFPGGRRKHTGGFSDLGDAAIFWSTSPDGSSPGWPRSLHYDSARMGKGFYYRSFGLSVRCIKN